MSNFFGFIGEGAGTAPASPKPRSAIISGVSNSPNPRDAKVCI